MRRANKELFQGFDTTIAAPVDFSRWSLFLNSEMATILATMFLAMGILFLFAGLIF
jgi:hypothetical protein